MILLAILFYQLSWKPRQESKENLANNIKCQQEGFQLFEKDKLSLTNRDKALIPPEFRFVKELNTCLYSGNFIFYDSTGSTFLVFIKDVYTNKMLTSYTSFSVKNGDIKLLDDRDKYDLMLAKYFPRN